MNISDRLNGICPYFTMFPLNFPLRILKKYARRREWVLDPFSGRGTTNYAARLLGLPSIGIDSSPVAAALTEAKLVNTTPSKIVRCARQILAESGDTQVPVGEFWETAYHPNVLQEVCKLRDNLFLDHNSDTRKALRAVIMGALHGPVTKSNSYLSNQCTRTYAPKPRYAVKFWNSRRMSPPEVNVLDLIERKANRYYSNQPMGRGISVSGDSRQPEVYNQLDKNRVKWIITSPPYYGMRTYNPDQWLRYWFVGGPSEVDYTNENQLDHGSPEEFSSQLRKVWNNVANIASHDARLVIRFGSIADRNIDSLALLKKSLKDSPWVLRTVKPAGSADFGRRQANHFAIDAEEAKAEYDAWAVLR